MAQPEVQKVGEETEAAVKFTAIKPQLMVEAPRAVDAVQFYKKAFGAVEAGRTVYPKRKAEQELPHILSAQLELAGSTILVSDIADDSAPYALPFLPLSLSLSKVFLLLCLFLHFFTHVLFYKRIMMV